MSSSEYWKGLTHNEIRARVVQYMESLLTQARTLVPYRFSSPATSLPAADLVFWKVSHGCRGPFVSRTASFPTTSGSPQCSDLAYPGQYAWGATGNENMQRGMRRYMWGGRRGSHPPAPADPGVTISRHRALVTLTTRNRAPMPSGR